jgi:hypothetical protein
MVKGQKKLPVRYGVFAKIGNSKYQRHTWALPKRDARSFASHIKGSSLVSKVSVKRLSSQTVRKDIQKTKRVNSLPPSIKTLIRRFG